jgi:hypothetical protein
MEAIIAVFWLKTFFANRYVNKQVIEPSKAWISLVQMMDELLAE